MGFIVRVPTPDDHWAKMPPPDEPPAPLRCGVSSPYREELVSGIREGVRYALQVARKHGMTGEFDYDAVVQNAIIGVVGYFSEDGR